jgi:hypothetical protein
MTTTNQRHQPSWAWRWTGGGWTYGAEAERPGAPQGITNTHRE